MSLRKAAEFQRHLLSSWDQKHPCPQGPVSVDALSLWGAPGAVPRCHKRGIHTTGVWPGQFISHVPVPEADLLPAHNSKGQSSGGRRAVSVCHEGKLSANASPCLQEISTGRKKIETLSNAQTQPPKSNMCQASSLTGLSLTG